MARVVGEVQPKYVFVENSPMLVTRGLERVLGDLTSLGYDTKWTVMGAADVGANHQRDRIWIVAYAREIRLERNLQKKQIRQQGQTISSMGRWDGSINTLPKPIGLRSLNGVAAGVDRLKAIGNGQVPLCAATAWRLLSEL
jgi:DNA (cytosine-5)-methyltransferase 1